MKPRKLCVETSTYSDQPYSERVRKQTGVIPFYVDDDGEIYVMLIGSRHAGNWSIPKGKKEKHLSKKDSAAIEAYEEAGIRGKILGRIGEYQYRKGSTGVMQNVIVYGMKVRKQLKQFPEADMRVRKWFKLDKAAKKIGKKLAPIILAVRNLVQE